MVPYLEDTVRRFITAERLHRSDGRTEREPNERSEADGHSSCTIRHRAPDTELPRVRELLLER
jgi:hypothetical protein